MLLPVKTIMSFLFLLLINELFSVDSKNTCDVIKQNESELTNTDFEKK